MKKYLSFVFVITMFTTCISDSTEEIGNPFKKGQEVTLLASIGNNQTNAKFLPNKQCIYGTDSNPDDPKSGSIILTWNEGDQILVTVDNQTAIFTLEDGAGTTNGLFKGIMPANGTSYKVQYPINTPLLSEQKYVEGGFGNGLMQMEGIGDLDNGFVLSAQNALLGLQLTGKQEISKIIVTNSENGDTYTLNCSNVALSTANTIFYIVVPTGTWKNGFVVDIYGANDNTLIKQLSTNKSTTFDTNNAVIMPALSISPYNPMGFSINESGSQVFFSKGNLQYTQSTQTWSFAENQYDYIGENNLKFDDNGHAILEDKIDWFGQSTDNIATPFGISLSNSGDDYVGGFVDWGTNQIGHDAPYTWRTLSKTEWEYLLKTRIKANELVGVACIDNINGLILLPDGWVTPEGEIFKAGFEDYGGDSYYAQHQTLTKSQWQQFESAGAIFLPAAGIRKVRSANTLYWDISEINSEGTYRTSTKSELLSTNHWSWHICSFTPTSVNTPSSNNLYGYSVRLVKDL